MPSRAPRIHVSRSETGFTNKKWAEAHLHFRNHKILPRTGSPKERKNGRYTLKNAGAGGVRKRHSPELNAWSLLFPSLFFRTAQKNGSPGPPVPVSPNHKSGALPHEAH